MARRNLKDEDEPKPSFDWLMKHSRYPVTPLDRSNVQPRYNGVTVSRILRYDGHVESKYEVEA